MKEPEDKVPESELPDEANKEVLDELARAGR